MERNNRKIPKSVYFVLVCKLLERFCATGISTILVVYLHNKLGFDQSSSAAIFHLNELFTFFFPLVGAVIAENYYGLFKTILTVCFIAFFGSSIVTVASIGDVNNFKIVITLIGLILVYSSLGSMRSNLVAFGADQYILPREVESQKLFFSLQMLCIKFGSLTGQITMPILREDVQCFGADSCYTLAFGVPSLSILLACLILFSGSSTFIHITPSGNMFTKFLKSILYALKMKFKRNKSEVKDHWLDYAADKFGADHIKATKVVLENLTVFLPTAFYWAILMQQGSTYIFQAMRMEGDLGFMTIKPDQMIALNSIFSIIAIPICNFVLFPMLSRIGLGGLLQRITIGGFLCCISFIFAATVEVHIEFKKVSILWLVPQFAILAFSENFVYISLIDFAYSKTPQGMKSVMTAFVFLLIAFGNLFITVMSSFRIFSSQLNSFVFYIVVLLVDMFIFILISIRYVRRKSRHETQL